MDPVTNPFRPGGRTPAPCSPGGSPSWRRSPSCAAKVDELGEGDRGWILNGLRGVGKTVLLNELLAQVSDKGWITAKVEVTPTISLPVALSSALVREPGARRSAP